jgi:hypothetical protein
MTVGTLDDRDRKAVGAQQVLTHMHVPRGNIFPGRASLPQLTTLPKIDAEPPEPHTNETV